MKLLFNGLEKKRQTAAGLAQLVERLTVEREVTGSIPGAGLILRVHVLRNEATTFGSDAPHKMAVPSPIGDVKIVSSISTFVLNILTLK